MTVKKLRYLAFALTAVAFCACQKEPSTSSLHKDYLVYTAHDTDVDFAAFDTYYIPDSILLIGSADKTEYWKDANALEIVNTVVASTKVELTVNDPVSGERMVRRQETNLGDLCADAYRAMSGADIAVVNGGGIRVSIPAGDITYGQIIAVHPFGNEMCVVEATGQQDRKSVV